VVEVVRAARDALDRRDWLAAYQGLSAAGDASLRAADFVDLATAAYLLCRREDCVTAMQRAHQAYLASGDCEAGVRTAFWLSLILRQSGEGAVANGWINRAERLAANLPEDSVEHGYVEFARLMRDVFSGKERFDHRRTVGSSSRDHRHLFIFRKVIHHNVEHEPIQLGLGQGISAFHFDWVLGRQDKEGLFQSMAHPGGRHLVLLHGFEQSRLRLGRRAIDFIG